MRRSNIDALRFSKRWKNVDVPSPMTAPIVVKHRDGSNHSGFTAGEFERLESSIVFLGTLFHTRINCQPATAKMKPAICKLPENVQAFLHCKVSHTAGNTCTDNFVDLNSSLPSQTGESTASGRCGCGNQKFPESRH